MRVRYYIDPATGEPHIYNHEVSETEAEEVLSQGDSLPGREGARMALGPTAAGRHLRVIYKPDEYQPDTLFVITAFELRGKALKAYRRRHRR